MRFALSAFLLALPLARLAAQDPSLVAPTNALTPEEERKQFVVPDGFEVQLVASEPDIQKPMQMAFDAKGRIWFADPYNDVLPFGPRFFPPLDHASVLRLARNDRHDWVLTRVTYDTQSPRAVALSADERMLFVAEGEAKPQKLRELRAYPVLDDLSVGPPAVLMTFGSDHRGPHRGIEGLARTKDGDIISGLVLKENARAVTIATSDHPEAPVEVLKSKIQERAKSTTSMMPENLLDAYTPEQISGLIALLLAGPGGLQK